MIKTVNTGTFEKINYIRDLPLPRLEQFLLDKLRKAGIHRQKSVKEVLKSIITVNLAINRLENKSLSIATSSGVLAKITGYSRRTIFRALQTIRTNFPDLIQVSKQKVNFQNVNCFKVNEQQLEILKTVLTENELEQIEEFIQELGLKKTPEEIIRDIKQKENLPMKKLQKFIKQKLKNKQQFKQYLQNIYASQNTAENKAKMTFEQLKEMLMEKGINNLEYMKAVHRLLQKGKKLETAMQYAKIKYPPII